ncbi:unnamed protein product, partial [marine sediment metagenome]
GGMLPVVNLVGVGSLTGEGPPLVMGTAYTGFVAHRLI